MAPLAPLLRPAGQRLWKPGQVKPSGTPRIEWTHPLANGLVSYWWNIGPVFIDLVTADITTKGTGTRNAFPSGIPSAYGTGCGFTTTTSMAQSTLNGSLQSWAAPYSMAVGFYQIGAATFNSFPAYFGLIDASQNDAWAITLTAATTLGISYGNSASPFNFTFSSNTFYVVVGSATGTTAQSSWVNGLAQTAGTAISAFAGSAQKYILGGGATNSSDVTSIMNANVFFGAAWSGRALSASDAALLYAEPYCFLTPQEPEMMIIQSAVTDVLAPQIWM